MCFSSVLIRDMLSHVVGEVARNSLRHIQIGGWFADYREQSSQLSKYPDHCTNHSLFYNIIQNVTFIRTALALEPFSDVMKCKYKVNGHMFYFILIVLSVFIWRIYDKCGMIMYVILIALCVGSHMYAI